MLVIMSYLPCDEVFLCHDIVINYRGITYHPCILFTYLFCLCKITKIFVIYISLKESSKVQTFVVVKTGFASSNLLSWLVTKTVHKRPRIIQLADLKVEF